VTPKDIGEVLAVAAAFDNRTVGTTDIVAWHKVIGHLSLEEARAAVYAHYADTADRLMPTHILSRVKKIHAARIAARPDALPNVDPDDVGAYLRALRDGRMPAHADLPAGPENPQAIERIFVYVESAWNRAGKSLTRPVMRALEAADDPAYAAAREVLATHGGRGPWLAAALASLAIDGVDDPTPQQITIRGAEIATQSPNGA
jgi:hypothetical protein